MRYCSFMAGGRHRFGLVTEGGIVDLVERTGAADLRALIAAHALPEAVRFASEAPDYAFVDVTHLPVIPEPEKILCVGLNYGKHVEETGRQETTWPVLFPRYGRSQVGHDQPMICPRESEQFDYEGELALIIGREGRRIPEERAMDHIAGYACFNDGSVRDWQFHTHQFLPGKVFAQSGAFGPWMVSADEIPDPSALHIQTRLNGAVVQDADLSQLIFSIPRLISYCSTLLPLVPGDVIVTGTPDGIGSRRTPPLWLRPGDTCEVEISKIGVLKNTIADEAADA